MKKLLVECYLQDAYASITAKMCVELEYDGTMHHYEETATVFKKNQTDKMEVLLDRRFFFMFKTLDPGTDFEHLVENAVLRIAVHVLDCERRCKSSCTSFLNCECVGSWRKANSKTSLSRGWGSP